MRIVEPSVQPCYRHHGAGGLMALVCVCCPYWPPLWSSCSAHRSPVSPPGEPASLHVLCKEWRGPIPTLGCHLGPGHTQSGLWVSHGVPWGDWVIWLIFFHPLTALFLSQPQNSLSCIYCCWGFSSILKCFLKIQIQLEHHLDGTGQRDSAASKKSPGKHSKS